MVVDDCNEVAGESATGAVPRGSWLVPVVVNRVRVLK